MKRKILLFVTAIASLCFFSCKEDFSVSDEIEISTTKGTIDANYETLNELVKKINEQHLHQEVQLKFPQSNRPFIQVGVSKTKTSFDLPGKKGETFSLKVNLTLNYDETRAEEAAAILRFYKKIYSEELRKLNVPLMKSEEVVSAS